MHKNYMDKNLKELREEKNLSIQELSLLAGIPVSHLLELENGECKDPYLDVLSKLMSSLKCNFEELYCAIQNS